MRVTVHVQPKARVTDLRLDVDGTLRARVTAPPEGGKANEAVRALLAEALGVPKRDVVIVTGQKARRKAFDVPLDEGELRARLGA